MSGQGSRRRVRRREFLGRYLGNLMLATGGSLFGAAAAYQLYSHNAEAGLSSLKRGTITYAPSPAAPAASNTAIPEDTAEPTAASDQRTPAATPAGVGPPTALAGHEPAIFAATAQAVAAIDTPAALMPIKLRIQAIGLNDARVIEVGTKMEKGQLVWETADHAVGHMIGTALPGQTGNVVLSGHISSPLKGEGSVFRNLPSIADKLGSRASVQTANGAWFHYEITGTDVVLPIDIWVMDPTPAPALTLITCVPDGVYTHRFIARGRLTGKS